MSEEKKIEYSNGEVKVVWKPGLCIHAGECVKGSPEVFKPKERPWVQIEKSTSEAIMATVDNCPSGALTYEKEEKPEITEKTGSFRIKASKNGPFIIKGNLEIEDGEGKIRVCESKVTALCRCGASGTKPFCDGSHTRNKFWG